MDQETYKSRWANPEVVMFQDVARRFFAKEFVPKLEGWRQKGCIDREVWLSAGELGLLGASLPVKYGGSGGGKEFMAAILLEQGRVGDASWGISVHNYVMHYILAYGTEEQKKRWLPGLASGRLVAAIAMTEPGAGSDLKQLITTANRRGDSYIVNGQKTFISNGQAADLICVAVRTGPDVGSRGISLVMVEGDAPGFRRGRALKKIGLHAADTSELFFDEATVSASNLLGGVEGKGFVQLMSQLPWERLSIAVRSLGIAEFALATTLDHVHSRKIFGRTLFDLQNTQFKLAEAKTKLEAMRAFVDTSLDRLVSGNLDVTAAATCKLFCSEAVNEIVNECLQLHGGYGFMEEYPIARLYGDVRAQTIYGGTSEIMKLLIARNLAI